MERLKEYRTRLLTWIRDIKNLYPQCSEEVIELLVQNHFDDGNYSLEGFLKVNHDCLLGSPSTDAHNVFESRYAIK